MYTIHCTYKRIPKTQEKKERTCARDLPLIIVFEWTGATTTDKKLPIAENYTQWDIYIYKHACLNHNRCQLKIPVYIKCQYRTKGGHWYIPTISKTILKRFRWTTKSKEINLKLSFGFCSARVRESIILYLCIVFCCIYITVGILLFLLLLQVSNSYMHAHARISTDLLT